MFSFGDHGKERIESNHAIHFLYGHVQFAGDDTLHLFRLVPMLVANLSAFFMIACNLQVGRIFMGIRISVLQRSEMSGLIKEEWKYEKEARSVWW